MKIERCRKRKKRDFPLVRYGELRYSIHSCPDLKYEALKLETCGHVQLGNSFTYAIRLHLSFTYFVAWQNRISSAFM